MGRRRSQNNLSFVEKDGTPAPAEADPSGENGEDGAPDPADAAAPAAPVIDAVVQPEAQPPVASTLPVESGDDGKAEIPIQQSTDGVDGASRQADAGIEIQESTIVRYRQSNGKSRPAKVLKVGPDGSLDIEMLTNGHRWNDVKPGLEPGQWHLPD